MRSAAVKAGGGGVLVLGGATVECPPCGDGSWEVLAMSPTATHVEQERDACSNLECHKDYCKNDWIRIE